MNYVGCFNDNEPRDLSYNVAGYSSMTIEYCYNQCRIKNFKYAALQYQ